MEMYDQVNNLLCPAVYLALYLSPFLNSVSLCLCLWGLCLMVVRVLQVSDCVELFRRLELSQVQCKCVCFQE